MKTLKLIFLLVVVVVLRANICFAKDYKGAEYRTKASYLYGRFEVKYKASAGDGHVSTFFTYHEIQSSSEWNEIDIEIHGRYTDDVQITTIVPNQIVHLRHQFVDFDPHTDYHTYAFEWTPDYVAWFIDDQEVYRQTEAHVKTLTRPQKIMMNIWNPAHENWVGPWDNRILPRFAYYDYVSYSSYTPGKGNVGTNHNFTFEWQDEFDFWDQNRWEKATHTFPGNNCDFVPENVVFQDGKLILCLTDNNYPGFQDRNPPAMLWARVDENTITVRFSEELEKNSAEQKSNYFIAGATIENAVLLSDGRTVKLTVNGLDMNETYTLYSLNIKDTLPGTNSLLGQSVNVEMPKPLQFPIKINVGGAAYQDYLPDQEWNSSVEYGFLDGTDAHNVFQITNTDEDAIFHSERNGLAAYKVRVPNGSYRVTLMMAENFFTEENKRYFDIFAEGRLIEEHLDLFLGGFHAATYLTIEEVQVQDKILDLHFCAGIDNPLLNGLVIEAIDTKVNGENSDSPERFSLLQNYPNPFNSSTTITYFLPTRSHISMTVYDSLGNQIVQLADQTQNSGYHSIIWDTALPSGIYFCKLTSHIQNRSFVKFQKMLLLK